MTALPPMDFYSGLRELAESAFPKRCRNCGRTYASSAEFIAATRPVTANQSGLKATQDEDGTVILELFRNCVCGSTLMDAFNDRRDTSGKGQKRRGRFADIQAHLIRQGVPPETAHAELLKVVHGHSSELLARFAGKPPGK